ncbi:oxidoreductase, short chain dehydrogenase/reductase family protein [Necator americanus]|uniref:Hydroxysteroid dehydrogenase-like protein 2 n=1 Tax=Necator americanus TaxID=51031 RepID=W2SP49_NECAM|nr:oxidoreductase, short chain dehydrogenase/reductase family protein [Necator americanus]ETN70482.1 oxidoreductase, short chain dehydrogenase/reductase family protein [Necator americanus]
MFNTGKFFGRTVVITGASRGIGKEIALKLAKDGANIVVAAKTTTAHPKLPGTIYTAAEEIEKAGGKALPCVVDVRDEESVRSAVESAVKKFGGIDILINNASAISLTNTEDTPMKRYDLMHSINTRGTFLMSKMCLPYLKQGKNAHILNISPPLLMETRWFSNHVAYTMAKFGMSMCVLGMHEEFRPYGIAADIMADAAYAMLSKNSHEYTGNFAIDEEVLRAEGVTDFTRYAVDPDAPLTADFFIPNVENYPLTFSQSPERQKSVDSLKKAALEEDIGNVLTNMKKLVSKELVDKMSAVYEFTLTGGQERKITLDLKNASGSVTEHGDDKADVKFTLANTDFAPLFSGKITPTNAFMAKKLKIKGDMMKAMKLEGLLKKMNKSKL